MQLSSGSRLGPYEILSAIGAGGMGEVYRARDTRLGREVAIKVLPAHLSADTRLRERFEREARAISQLSHPHICTLHDLGRHDGIDYLVLELLEGETLADRLARGPLPLSQLIRYGSEIARALHRAHGSGVVHRDLKPSNVILTKTGAKVLDFGLARYATRDPGPATRDDTELPTEHKPITEEGVILGTIQYMSPEQLEGREADARSDLFALGAILYEMATGKRAFTGKSRASLIASILEHEPEPISKLPMVPAALDRVVRICLRKDPDERWQSAQDVALELEAINEVREPTPTSSGRWMAIAAALAVAGLLMGFLIARAPRWSGAPASPGPVHFSFFPPEDGFVPLHRQNVMFAISPDGRRVAFVVGMTRQSQLWVHSIDSDETRAIPGTEGATSPFWSPDGNFIGFHAGGKLMKVDLRAGDVQTICTISKTGAVADWGPDGTIVFVENAGAPAIVKRVAASGGKPVDIGGLPPETDGTRRRWRNPKFLPDGKHFLVYSSRAGVGRTLYVRSLDDKIRKRLFDTDSKVRFAPPDVMAFVRDGVLMAQRLDLRRLEPVGDPVAVANAVHYFSPTGTALFDVSETALVYQSRAAANQLVWVDRTGAAIGSVGDIEGLQAPAVSPDGRMVAVSVADSKGGVADIWVYDLGRGFRNRLTWKEGFESFPVWSPDGKRIVFSADRPVGPPHLQVISITGPQTAEQLTDADFIQVPTDWSSDGRLILFTKASVAAAQDIWIVNVADRKARTLITSEADERDARFSPDNRWVAFTSDETGAAEIYVASLDRPSQRLRVSTRGGKGARWSGDGTELFYINDKSELLSVPVKRGASIDFGAPRVITRLEGTRASSAEIDEDYTYDPRSGRFLINRANTGRLSVPVQVIMNWQSLIGR